MTFLAWTLEFAIKVMEYNNKNNNNNDSNNTNNSSYQADKFVIFINLETFSFCRETLMMLITSYPERLGKR
jgi:hypothetical protein